MEVLVYELLNAKKDGSLLSECSDYFITNISDLEALVKVVADGKVQDNILKDAFQQIKKDCTDHDKVIKAVFELGIAASSYKQFADFN